MLVEPFISLINIGNIRILFNSTLHFSHIKMQLSIQPQFQYPQQRLVHLSHITTMPVSPHSAAPHPPHFQFSPANSHFEDHLRSGAPGATTQRNCDKHVCSNFRRGVGKSLFSARRGQNKSPNILRWRFLLFCGLGVSFFGCPGALPEHFFQNRVFFLRSRLALC